MKRKEPGNVLAVVAIIIVIILAVILGKGCDPGSDYQACEVIIVDQNTLFLNNLEGGPSVTLLVSDAYSINEHIIYLK